MSLSHRLSRLLIGAVALSCTACIDFTDESDDRAVERGAQPGGPRSIDDRIDPAPPAEPEARALPAPRCLDDHPDDLRVVRRIRQIAEASVHELVTCGGAQLSAINSMVARVFLSNPQFFDAETIDTLKSALGLQDLAFEHSVDGVWRMPINARSAFDMHFFLPGAEQREAGDVFDLETYLVGAQVETSLSFDEMLADPALENLYLVTWDDYGPLADLMFPEGRPEQRHFTVRLSLLDFVALYLGDSEAEDFGPFGNLVDLEIDSKVDLIDAREGVEVTYAFASDRQPLSHLHDTQAVPFALHSLVATDGRVTLQGAAANLTVEGVGSLSGVLIYAVDGIAVDDFRVVDDFGEGAGYPEASDWCPEDWADSPYADPDVME